MQAMIFSPEALGTAFLISFVWFRPECLLALDHPGLTRFTPSRARAMVLGLIFRSRILTSSGTTATLDEYSSIHMSICALK